MPEIATLIPWLAENYASLLTGLIILLTSLFIYLNSSGSVQSPSSLLTLESELYDAELSDYAEELRKSHDSLKTAKVTWELAVSSKSVSVAEHGVLRIIEFTKNSSRPSPQHVFETIAKAILSPIEIENKSIVKPECIALLETSILTIKDRIAVDSLLKPFSIKLATLAELEKDLPELFQARFATSSPTVPVAPAPIIPPTPSGPQEPIPFNPAPSRGCISCKKDIVGKASQCSACKAVIYDSVECAKKDWTTHKQACPGFKICMDHISDWAMHDMPFEFYNSSKILHNYNVVPFLSLHSKHNVGLFQRLCGCFGQIPWGGLNANRLLKFHTQKPNPEQMFQDYGLPEEMFPLSKDFPEGFDISTLTSWKSYYNARGYSMDNPAALVLEVPLTIFHMIQKFYLPTAPSVPIGERRRITIHLIGAEKEADLLPLFECLLPLFPKCDIAIHMIGNKIQPDIPAAQRAMAIRSIKNDSSVFLSVTPSLYQPQHLDGTAYKLPENVPQEVLESQNFGEGRPDFIIALNAELVVHGEWFPVLSMIAKSGIRFMVSERMEQLCMAAEANIPKTGTTTSIKTQPNPFKQPLFEFRKDVNLPGWSNGFMFGIN